MVYHETIRMISVFIRSKINDIQNANNYMDGPLKISYQFTIYGGPWLHFGINQINCTSTTNNSHRTSTVNVIGIAMITIIVVPNAILRLCFIQPNYVASSLTSFPPPLLGSAPPNGISFGVNGWTISPVWTFFQVPSISWSVAPSHTGPEVSLRQEISWFQLKMSAQGHRMASGIQKCSLPWTFQFWTRRDVLPMMVLEVLSLNSHNMIWHLQKSFYLEPHVFSLVRLTIFSLLFDLSLSNLEP